MQKLLFGLIVISLFACAENEKDRHIEVVQEEPIDTVRTTGFTVEEGAYVIDTVAILTNQNLDPLIAAVEEAELVTYDDVRDIPPFIKTFLDSLTGGDFSIVNYGEDWQETDIIEEGLAERELVYLGKSDNITLLAYHTGGIGKSEHILIFKHKDDYITDFWAGNILKTLKTKEEITKYIKENKGKEWGLNTNIIYL